MMRRNRQVTCGNIITSGTRCASNEGYRDEMSGCVGETYAERKIDLLAQLGHHVPDDIFDGMSETEIDRKARAIILA